MTTYGYLLDLVYQSKESEIIWDFERFESEGIATSYKGIEGIDLQSCEYYVIIGDSEAFREWLITDYEPNYDDFE